MTALYRVAPTLYMDLPYHNFDHALEVWRNAKHLIERCRQYGIPVDPCVVEVACLLHDGGFWWNPQNTYVHSNGRERLAMVREAIHHELAERTLTDLGFEAPLIEAVGHCIDATNPMTTPRTVEATIVAAADTMAVGIGSFKRFMTEGQLLQDEIGVLTGNRPDWKTSTRFGMSYLGQFLARRLYLTPQYCNPEGTSAWHLGAMHNILARCRDAAFGPVVVDISSNGVPAPIVEHGENMVSISVCPRHKWRLRAMRAITRTAKSKLPAQPVTLALPSEPARLSLPSRCADELKISVSEGLRLMRTGFDPDEIRRILGNGRPLTVYEVQVGRSTLPFTETDAFDRLDAWLSGHFSGKVIEETDYGTTATYVAN